jgi:hypothetical protein
MNPILADLFRRLTDQQRALLRALVENHHTFRQQASFYRKCNLDWVFVSQ